MRAWMLGMAIFLVPSVAWSQNTKTPPPPKNDARLDQLLQGWEKKSTAVRDVECEFRRITRDRLFKTEEIEYGKAVGIKPYLGRLDLKNEKKQFTQIFIYTGKRIHNYNFESKQEIIHVLPDADPDSNKSLPGALGFLYGMSAAEAKSRFKLTLVREFPKNGINYAEIHAEPRTQADQQEFKTAQIAIDTKTFLPKELRTFESNGNEQHWIFDRLETNLNPPVSAADLQPFDRKEFKELESWKQQVVNYGDPQKNSPPAVAPSNKTLTPPKAPKEAGKQLAPKR